MITIIIFLIISIIMLFFICNINLKKLKKFVNNKEDELNKIVEKYPNNIEICKYLLKKLNNNNVKIEEDKNANNSLYIAITNKIIIANIRNSFTRIQTIAHECLHSVQDRKILLFNYFFSNIYLIYFIIVTILGFFNKINEKIIFLSIMLILGYIYYFIRSYLEIDAMTKARFLSKEYMEETKISSYEEIQKIVEAYDEINKSGIKITIFRLFFETVIRTIIMAIVFII